MRILHIIYDHPSNPWVGGGGAVRAYELNRRLAEKGHDITVLSGAYPGAQDYDEGNQKFLFLGCKSSYALSTMGFALSSMFYIVRHTKDYDLIVEDFAPYNPVFSTLLSHRPAVLHVNHKEGIGLLKRRPITGMLFYIVERFYPLLFKHITALSEGTKRKLALKQTVVIPAGINQETIVPAPAVSEGRYIIYAGRLSIKNKGLDTLSDAMRMLAGESLILVGRGRDEQKLRSMMQGIKAEFIGFVDEQKKIELIRGASVLVLPSRFEGWGIVAMEAAAAGTPVVASDIEELGFVPGGGFGLAFKTGDAKDLAEKISSVLKDPALRRSMAKNALTYIKDCTWDAIAVGYEKYLMETIGSDR